MANLKTRLSKCRSKFRSLNNAALEGQIKTSGLISLDNDIQELIADIGYKKHCDLKEEFGWLYGQLVCLRGRIKKEIIVANDPSKHQVTLFKLSYLYLHLVLCSFCLTITMKISKILFV